MNSLKSVFWTTESCLDVKDYVEGDQSKPMWLKQTWDLVSQLSLIEGMQGRPTHIAGAYVSFYSLSLMEKPLCLCVITCHGS